jgi:hypothetical protein
MRVVKIVGLALATAAVAAWIGSGSAAAKGAWGKATGKTCADCHTGAPKDKTLTPAGQKFKDCFDRTKDAAKCK